MKNRARGSGSVVSIFSGYPPQLLQEWCLASYQTVMHWKRGTRPPSRLAVKVFRLHSQGQIISPLFDGCRFHEKNGELILPEDVTVTLGRIRAYEMMNRNGAFREVYGAEYVEKMIEAAERRAG